MDSVSNARLRARTLYGSSEGALRRLAACEPGAIGNTPPTPDPSRPGWWRTTVHIIVDDQAAPAPAWEAQLRRPAVSTDLVPVPRVAASTRATRPTPARRTMATRAASSTGRAYRRARSIPRRHVIRAAKVTLTAAAGTAATWLAYELVMWVIRAVAWVMAHGWELFGGLVALVLVLALAHSAAHSCGCCPTCGRR